MKHLLSVTLIALFPIMTQGQKIYSYAGAPISDNKGNVTHVGDLIPHSKTYFQGMAIYNDRLVSLEHSDIATIYSLKGEKMERKGSIHLQTQTMGIQRLDFLK